MIVVVQWKHEKSEAISMEELSSLLCSESIHIGPSKRNYKHKSLLLPMLLLKIQVPIIVEVVSLLDGIEVISEVVPEVEGFLMETQCGLPNLWKKQSFCP